MAHVDDAAVPPASSHPHTANRSVPRFVGRLSPDATTTLTKSDLWAKGRARRKPFGAYHAKEVDVSASLEETGPLIVVSVKAPASSVAKNAVNRYEEGIGEATNLHARFPMLVFGFVMVLPLVDEIYQSGRGATPSFRNLENLIGATSIRRAITDPSAAYEAAALVLVNYTAHPPMVVPDAPAPGSPLRIETFFDRLIELHRERNRAID